jgi:3',5'-cyclic AMP phosphodiesterase CpdA
MAPYTNEKDEYYTYLFNLWFSEGSFNGKNLDTSAIKKTFMNGGYYRVDLSKSVSVLALNTLYYNKKNDPTQMTTEGADQFNWLTEQLANAEDSRKFILTSHIYPGSKYVQKEKELWND